MNPRIMSDIDTNKYLLASKERFAKGENIEEKRKCR